VAESNLPSSFLFLLFYLADAAITAYFIAAMYREARRLRSDISFKHILKLLKDEINRLRKGKVAYLHLSIFGGVGLSILFILLYPLISMYEVLIIIELAISIVLSVGLLAAAVWRIQILFQSRNVHRVLGEELKINDEFKSRSLFFQSILIVVILLTMFDLDLAAIPFRDSFYYASVVFVVRTALVALLYVKPALNTYVNIDMKVFEITTPFNINDVLQGKVDDSLSG